MRPPRPGEPFPLVTGAEARAADESAVAAGDSWDGLLTRAGGALARVVVDRLQGTTGGVYGRRVLIVAGKGDNGGDGWVCASRLRERGVAVTVLATHGLDVEASPHSARARSAWLGSGGEAIDGVEGRPREWWFRRRFDLVVDCILGTGARGAPRGAAADGLDLLTGVASVGRGGVVACDVPSGVDADTGEVERFAVHAAVTVTFGAAKRGLYLEPGRRHAGEVVVADLGDGWWQALLRQAPPDEAGRAHGPVPFWLATSDGFAAPRRLGVTDDKLARGRVLVVAGSRRYAGAGALAAAAAVRHGAGLVTLATSGPAQAVRALEPGVMVLDLPAEPDEVGGPSASGVDVVGPLERDGEDGLDAVHGAVVVGPGLGHGAGTRAVVEAALGIGGPQDEGPMKVAGWLGDEPPSPSELTALRASARRRRGVAVVDADACNVFRGDAAALRGASRLLVLTPHARELARLLGVQVPNTASERVAAAERLAELTGAIVVAKGAPSIVVAPDGSVAVVTSGGPALGSGGTGDVLAGLLGAALAPPGVGSWTGDPAEIFPLVAGTVHLHGLLGDRAGQRSGGRATARDLLELLPSTLADLARRREVERW